MTALRAVLARQPFVWFFALALLPMTLGQFLLWQRINVGTYPLFLLLSLGPAAAGPAAMLLCWATDGQPTLPRQTGRRLALFVAVTAPGRPGDDPPHPSPFGNDSTGR